MLKTLALLIGFFGTIPITGVVFVALFTGSLPSVTKWKQVG